MRQYMADLITVRQSAIPDVGRAGRAEEMHEYVKREVGYYDLIQTPDGLIKKTRSISFDKMSHEQFFVYYKKAFNVIWNLCLCKVFKDRDEAQAAIDRLNNYGN